MIDFEPSELVNRVPPVRVLLVARHNHLRDFQTTLGSQLALHLEDTLCKRGERGEALLTRYIAAPVSEITSPCVDRDVLSHHDERR